MLDCLVVGGGPAGLTAALYLARFHLSVLVVDAGQSRAESIPRTHNHSGYPEGIEGKVLVQRMRDHALRYGAVIRSGRVTSIRAVAEGFIAEAGGETIAARTVLLATGVKDRRPDMPATIHDKALAEGLLRYCPICDAYEVTDRSVAVLGGGEHGKAEAEFLLAYTSDVTLVTEAEAGSKTSSLIPELDALGVRVLEGPVRNFSLQDRQILVTLATGAYEFDSIYLALGCDTRTELGLALGAECDEKGALITDQHQQTSLPGLYAAGDVVEGINQISHAMGQAAVAATAIRNAIDAREPLRRRDRASPPAKSGTEELPEKCLCSSEV